MLCLIHTDCNISNRKQLVTTNHSPDTIDHLHQHFLHQLMQWSDLRWGEAVMNIHSLIQYLHLVMTLQLTNY